MSKKRTLIIWLVVIAVLVVAGIVVYLVISKKRGIEASTLYRYMTPTPPTQEQETATQGQCYANFTGGFVGSGENKTLTISQGTYVEVNAAYGGCTEITISAQPGAPHPSDPKSVDPLVAVPEGSWPITNGAAGTTMIRVTAPVQPTGEKTTSGRVQITGKSGASGKPIGDKIEVTIKPSSTPTSTIPPGFQPPSP